MELLAKRNQFSLFFVSFDRANRVPGKREHGTESLRRKIKGERRGESLTVFLFFVVSPIAEKLLR